VVERKSGRMWGWFCVWMKWCSWR